MVTRRDTLNPEGGGSEVYLESIARGLVGRGHEVTIFCGAHDKAGPNDIVDGVQFVRRGSKTGVHLEALRALRRNEFGPVDVIVDVQNGMPFFSKLAARHTPVVVLVHHIHREQWPVVYGPVRARIGWFLESRVSPRFYRGDQYVAVSDDTRNELIQLGVAPEAIHVIHNGTYDLAIEPATVAAQEFITDPQTMSRSVEAAEPRIVVLGRLVPHKRVEHVLAAAQSLRSKYPALRVTVVGDGWWAERLEADARARGVEDIVEFTGFVSEIRKHDELARAWVLAMPSLKEGWGLVIMEAARHGVPAIGYASAGGVAESIVDGETGLLVTGGEKQFTQAVDQLLADAGLRHRLGANARNYSRQFSWDQSVAEFEKLLSNVAVGGK